jgi:hypothetical protein
MDNFIKLLANSQKASQLANDTVGRALYPTLATVTANVDPDNKRRIKVALPSSPNIDSYWFRKLVVNKDSDCSVPDIGQTVFIFFANGIETDGYYLQVYNDTNPVQSKTDAINDHVEVIKGKKTLTINGNNTTTITGINSITSTGNNTVSSQQNIIMSALQALSLVATQYLLLQAGSWFVKLFPNGTTEMGGGDLTVNCGGYGINLINCSSLSVNGKQITTIGAVDTRGDSLVSKGW